MSLSTKKIHGNSYLYLSAGRSKTRLLGPANTTDPSKFKTENVKEGLDYVLQRAENYVDIYLKLISLLPEEEKAEYISKLKKLIGK